MSSIAIHTLRICPVCDALVARAEGANRRTPLCPACEASACNEERYHAARAAQLYRSLPREAAAYEDLRAVRGIVCALKITAALLAMLAMVFAGAVLAGPWRYAAVVGNLAALAFFATEIRRA